MPENKEESHFWEIKNWKIVKFITNKVVILILLGMICFIVGQTNFLSKNVPFLELHGLTDAFIRSLGTAFIGGGVFSAVIKSQDFLEIYKRVFEDVLWSPEFLKRRGDLRELWNQVSRLLYQEKFPNLSAEIEEIITSQYFPTSHAYYIDDYDLVINIENLNDHFWLHNETISFTIKPTHNVNQILYSTKAEIYLPKKDIPNIDDITEFIIEEITVNGTSRPVGDKCLEVAKTDLSHSFTFQLELQGCNEYKTIIKRKKILAKNTNRDKRFFAKHFQKGSKITIISPKNLRIDFFKMGTINSFLKEIELENGEVKVWKWSYNGLILPHQGFIIITNES